MQERVTEERARQHARSSHRFSATMTVREAIDAHPQARWALTAWQFGGCGHCTISQEESLAEVAESYGIPLERLLTTLNGLA